jgi:hypothetical protein
MPHDYFAFYSKGLGSLHDKESFPSEFSLSHVASLLGDEECMVCV